MVYATVAAFAAAALLGLGVFIAPASAQDANAIQHENRRADLNRPIQEDAYAGVVVNQTVTLVGHDFYLSFVAAWRDKPSSEKYAVTVGERASVKLGSQVWVEFNRRRVYQAFLPPARARVRGQGEQAADIAYQNVVQSEAQRLLFRDPDLGADEI